MCFSSTVVASLPRMARALLAGLLLADFASALTSSTKLTACTCSCCEAGQQSFLRGSSVVCTPLFTIAASSCPGECNDLQAATAMALHHAELSDVSESATDYSRFCLQSCSPPTAKQSLCTPSVPLPLESSLLIEGALPAAPAPAPAAMAPLAAAAAAPASAETGTQVAQAEGQKAFAMALEAKVAQAEAMAAAAEAKATANLELAQSRGSLAEEITTELKESAARTGVYALSAAAAVKKAEQELKEIQEAPQMAAQEATKVAIRQLQQQEDMNQKVLETFQAHATATQPPSAAAANQAAEPYNAAIREVQRKQTLYESQASQLRDQAEQLQAGAQSMDHQLEVYASNPDLAKVIKAQSHDLLVKSLEKETAAEEAMDEARRVGQAVPKYTSQAAAAVARATIMGSTKWMPPSLAAPAGLAPAPAMAPAPAAGA
eukprot:s1096_g33.t1